QRRELTHGMGASPRRDPPLRRGVEPPRRTVSPRRAVPSVADRRPGRGADLPRPAAVGAPCSLAELGAARAPRRSAAYVAFVVDAYARRVLGWRGAAEIAPHLVRAWMRPDACTRT